VVLVDLRPKGLSGKAAERALDEAGITCNKNGIPFDPAKPAVTSGIRLGSPALTTRGFREAEFEKVAALIDQVLEAARSGEDLEGVTQRVRADVEALCKAFPIYGG
jgi:glycine hydroxymethyltransferase